MPPRPSLVRRSALAAGRSSLVLSLLLGACSKKDEAKCTEATQAVQSSVAAENFDLARQWRERAYKYCEDDGSLASLDSEIVNKQQQIAEKKAADDRRIAEATQLVGLFVDWAGKHQKAPAQAGANVRCEGEETPKKQRWCTIERKVSGKYTLEALYWEGEPEAVQFKTRVPHELDCKALGQHNVLKSWTTNGTKRSYCEITSGPLAGMKAVVSSIPTETEAKVFSAKFLEKDPALRQVVQG